MGRVFFTFYYSAKEDGFGTAPWVSSSFAPLAGAIGGVALCFVEVFPRTPQAWSVQEPTLSPQADVTLEHAVTRVIG